MSDGKPDLKTQNAVLKERLVHANTEPTQMKQELNDARIKNNRLEDELEKSKLEISHLKIDLGLAQQALTHKNEELCSLKKISRWKIFFKGCFSLSISVLMLLSGLLYTYAINKLTSNPPDPGANFLVELAVCVYFIAAIVQLINSGGHV
jgi:hypothetical protein